MNYNIMIIIKEAKEFKYDINDLKKRAEALYKEQKKNKVHNYSEKDALPGNIEAIIKTDVKKQFGYSLTRDPPYKVLKPIINDIFKQLKLGAKMLGY